MFQCRFPQVWHKTWFHIVARNCTLPFPWHTHKNCFTRNRTKISVLKLASWNSYYKSMRLLSKLLKKGKLAVLPDRAISGQFHYLKNRPRNLRITCPGITLFVLMTSPGLNTQHTDSKHSLSYWHSKPSGITTMRCKFVHFDTVFCIFYVGFFHW